MNLTCELLLELLILFFPRLTWLLQACKAQCCLCVLFTEPDGELRSSRLSVETNFCLINDW